MSKTLTERFPRPNPDELPDEVRAAIGAMNRAAEKMIQRKKALGYKLVVRKNGKFVLINPE